MNKKIVIDLFSKALKGELSIAEFNRKWPEFLEDDLFYEQLYDDLESAVEHMPGKYLFSKN